MRYLVTGGRGGLGSELMAILPGALGVDADTLDITDKDAVNECFRLYRPDIVLHCAAYTAVDAAETDRERCYAVNVDGTRHIAECAHECGASMLLVSTDYVFDGKGTHMRETDEPTAPLNYYGETKAKAEEIVKALPRHYIVRTSWLMGTQGKSFVNTILRLSNERGSLSVVDDQIGSPTFSHELAELIVKLAETKRYGIYHATNEGLCSFYELAAAIKRLWGLNMRIDPIPTAEYKTAAKRPLNSRLSKRSLDEAGIPRLVCWQDGLAILKARGEKA